MARCMSQWPFGAWRVQRTGHEAALACGAPVLRGGSVIFSEICKEDGDAVCEAELAYLDLVREGVPGPWEPDEDDV